MKRNWLPLTLIATAAVAGLICRSAQADNKGFKFQSGSSRNFQMSGGNGGQSNVARSLSTPSLGTSGLGSIKTQIKTHNGNLGLGINQNTQIRNNAGRLNGVTLGTQVLNKPAVVTKIGGLNGILKSQGSQSLNSQLLNSNVAKKIVPAILGNQQGTQKCFIDPGFNKNCSPCWSPCQIGFHPWWHGCYTWFDPCYKPCYPIVYTQPIIVPVAVPVVTEVAAVGAVVEEKLLQVPAGATLTLQALDLGTTAGQVVLQLNQMAMPAMVNEWKTDAVTATLPPMGLASPLKGEIIIVKADGKVASSIKVEVIPGQPQSNTGAAASNGAAQ